KGLTPEAILALQRTHGNRFVQRLVAQAHAESTPPASPPKDANSSPESNPSAEVKLSAPASIQPMRFYHVQTGHVVDVFHPGLLPGGMEGWRPLEETPMVTSEGYSPDEEVGVEEEFGYGGFTPDDDEETAVEDDFEYQSDGNDQGVEMEDSDEIPP